MFFCWLQFALGLGHSNLFPPPPPLHDMRQPPPNGFPGFSRAMIFPSFFLLLYPVTILFGLTCAEFPCALTPRFAWSLVIFMSGAPCWVSTRPVGTFSHPTFLPRCKACVGLLVRPVVFAQLNNEIVDPPATFHSPFLSHPGLKLYQFIPITYTL